MTTPASVDPTFVAAVERFLVGAQAIIDAGRNARYPELPRKTLALEWGRRYVRVWAFEGERRTHIYAFLDMTNGDVLKPAGYNKPFHSDVNPGSDARGNLFDPSSGASRLTDYGPEYLR